MKNIFLTAGLMLLAAIFLRVTYHCYPDRDTMTMMCELKIAPDFTP